MFCILYKCTCTSSVLYKCTMYCTVHIWAELHKKLVRPRPHQFFKISNVTARRLQFYQAMYCVKYLNGLTRI